MIADGGLLERGAAEDGLAPVLGLLERVAAEEEGRRVGRGGAEGLLGGALALGELGRDRGCAVVG